ncbi:MFS transporter [Tsukamurella sp. PLM1]|uniref:MFS transporter n=1 Tax=Tsukamurella sp. PLM1 TaxID=2929795 RepID=UPI00205B44EF|nr:MFS transporter [Tsukamurella sp. PLM1]BDH56690.1 MFS transporter [Tsukamurella sp. PLM1]
MPNTTTAPSQSRRTVALLALSLAFGLIQFDATVVNVVLGSMSRDLGGGLGTAQWAVDGYAIPFAALMLAAGPAADGFGRRRVCMLGFAVFAAATAGCAVAPDWTTLLACRALQGVAAAMILPSSLAMIGDLYPSPSERARALGVWGGIASAGFAAGPPEGGLLAAGSGWRAAFWVGVPIALVAGAALHRTVPRSPSQPRPIDYRGATFGAAGLALGTAALIELGQGRGTVALTYGAAALGATTAFIRSQRNGPHPMIPPGLMGRGPFRAAVTTGLVFNLALYGALLVVALALQDLHGFTVLETGMALLPMTVVIAAGSIISGFLTARTGPRPPMIAGFAAAAGGAVVVAAGAHHPAAITAGLCLIGAASLAMPAMTSVALAAAPAEHAGLAGAVLNCARQAGGALGVAAAGAIYSAAGRSGPALTLTFVIVAAILVVGVRTSIGATTVPEEVPCDAG